MASARLSIMPLRLLGNIKTLVGYKPFAIPSGVPVLSCIHVFFMSPSPRHRPAFRRDRPTRYPNGLAGNPWHAVTTSLGRKELGGTRYRLSEQQPCRFPTGLRQRPLIWEYEGGGESRKVEETKRCKADSGFVSYRSLLPARGACDCEIRASRHADSTPMAAHSRPSKAKNATKRKHC